ncbi:hypothetical protein DAT35_54900 [Vitiosangium sp. GDMCC 1.1324]|nr:hypothetical protein DAT35_54900 [Vitiosangium sp. GDMCC 1.1324]
MPGFFENWSLEDCRWLLLHALLIGWSSRLILLLEGRVLSSGAALLVACLAYGGILLSVARCLWSDWHARKVRFALGVEKRRKALRAARGDASRRMED